MATLRGLRIGAADDLWLDVGVPVVAVVLGIACAAAFLGRSVW